METPEKATEQASMPMMTPKTASGSQRVIKQIVVIDPNKLRLAGLDVKMAEALKKAKTPKTKGTSKPKPTNESKLAIAKNLLNKKLTEALSKKQTKAGQLTPSPPTPVPASNSKKTPPSAKISVATLKSLMPPPSFPMSSLISPNQKVEIKVLKPENATNQSFEVKIVDSNSETPKKITKFPKASIKSPPTMQTIIRTEAITPEIKFGVRKVIPKETKSPEASVLKEEKSKLTSAAGFVLTSIKGSQKKGTCSPVAAISIRTETSQNEQIKSNEQSKSLNEKAPTEQTKPLNKSFEPALVEQSQSCNNKNKNFEPALIEQSQTCNNNLEASLNEIPKAAVERTTHESLRECENHVETPTKIEVKVAQTNPQETAVEQVAQTPPPTEPQPKEINNSKLIIHPKTTSTPNRRESLPQVIESKVLSPSEKIDLSLLTNKTPIGLTVPKKRYKLDQNWITTEQTAEDDSVYLDLSAVISANSPEILPSTPKPAVVEESAVDFINNLSLLFAEGKQSESQTMADSLTKECGEDATSFLVSLFQKKQGCSPEAKDSDSLIVKPSPNVDNTKSSKDNEHLNATNKETVAQGPPNACLETLNPSEEKEMNDTKSEIPNPVQEKPNDLIASAVPPAAEVNPPVSCHPTSQIVSATKEELETPKSSVPSRRKTNKPIPVLVPKMRKSRKPTISAQNPPEEPVKQPVPPKPTEQPVEESPTQPVQEKDPLPKDPGTLPTSQKTPEKEDLPVTSKTISPIPNTERPKRQRKISLKLAESSELRSSITSSFQGIIDGTVEKAMSQKPETPMKSDKSNRQRKVSFKLSETEIKPSDPSEKEENMKVDNARPTTLEKPKRESKTNSKPSSDQIQTSLQQVEGNKTPPTSSGRPQRQRKPSLKLMDSSVAIKDQKQPPVTARETKEKESNELISVQVKEGVEKDPISQLDAFHETVEKFELACGSLKSKRVQDIAVDEEANSLSEYPFRDAIQRDSPAGKIVTSTDGKPNGESASRILRKRKGSMRSRNVSGDQIEITRDSSETQNPTDSAPPIEQSEKEKTKQQSLIEAEPLDTDLVLEKSHVTEKTPSPSIVKKKRGRLPKEQPPEGNSSTKPEVNITSLNDLSGSVEKQATAIEQLTERDKSAANKKSPNPNLNHSKKEKVVEENETETSSKKEDVVLATKPIETPTPPKRRGRPPKARKTINAEEESSTSECSTSVNENEDRAVKPPTIESLKLTEGSDAGLTSKDDSRLEEADHITQEIDSQSSATQEESHSKDNNLFEDTQPTTPLKTRDGTQTNLQLDDLVLDLDHIESPTFSPICDRSIISEDSNEFEDIDEDIASALIDTVTAAERSAEEVPLKQNSSAQNSDNNNVENSKQCQDDVQETSKSPENGSPSKDSSVSANTSSLYSYMPTPLIQKEPKNPFRRKQSHRKVKPQTAFLGFNDEEIVEGQQSTSLRLSQSEDVVVETSNVAELGSKQNVPQKTRGRKPKQEEQKWAKTSAKSLKDWLSNPATTTVESPASSGKVCDKDEDPSEQSSSVSSRRGGRKKAQIPDSESEAKTRRQSRTMEKILKAPQLIETTNTQETEQPVVIKTEPGVTNPPPPPARRAYKRKRSLPAVAPEPPAKRRYKDDAEFNPRLLLIRNKEELKSTEPLIDPSLQTKPSGPQDVQCGLCMGFTPKKTWMKHVSSHYGVGWILGEQPPLDIHSRGAMLNYFVEFFKVSKIKGMNCRICNSFRRSGLGLFNHLEQCCLTKEEISRVVCEYCKRDYTKASFLVHKRNCTEYLKEIVKESAALNTDEPAEGASQDEVLSNTGRLKRKSVIKAETKLKSLNESPDFIPEEFVKHIPSSKTPSLEATREKWNMEISTLGKGFCASKRCCFTATAIEDLEEHYVENVCQYFEKPGYFCMKCKFHHANDKDFVVKHVVDSHTPRQRKCDDEDAEIDSSESSDSISSGDEEVDSEGAGSGDLDENGEKKPKRTKKAKKKSKRRAFAAKNAPTKEYKKLLPERRTDIQQLVSKQYDKFIAMNYSIDALFTFAKPNHTHFEASESYFPKSPVSIKFLPNGFQGYVKSLGLSQVAADQWMQLERLHGMTDKDEYIIYMGGPVKNLAWAPLDSNLPSNIQYLAVTVRKDFDKFSRFCNQKLSRSLIFILKFDINKPAASGIKAEIIYAIAIDEGPIHAIEFLPSGGYSPEMNRLGMLAVACIETEIRIYSLPLSVEKHDCDLFPIVRLEVAMELCLELSADSSSNTENYNSQCTCLVWSQTAGHNIIVGGYVNGFVGIWDICDDADNLNRFDLNGKIKFTPVSYFWTSDDRLMHLALHYDSNGPRWLAASNSTRKIMTFDLRDITEPILFRMEITLNSITAVEWPVVWENAMFGLGDAMPSNGCIASAFSPMSIIYSHRRFDKFSTGVSTMDYNIWKNCFASAAENGDVQVVSIREAVLDVSQRLKTDTKTISTLDIVPLKEDKKISQTGIEMPPDGMRVFDNEFKNNYGIVFGSIKKLSGFKKPDYYNTQRVPPFNLQRLVKINKLKYNQNKNHCNVLAMGYNNGLLRVLAKDWLFEN